MPRLRQLHARRPEHRLSDAGLALHDKRRGDPVDGIEETPQLRKLLFPADDLGGHQTATLELWTLENKRRVLAATPVYLAN